MKFIDIPNLPENKVTEIIAGNGIKPFKNELSKSGVNILEIEENAQIGALVANHADMAVNYLGKGQFILEKSQKQLENALLSRNARCRFISDDLSQKYPGDCKLNCVFTEKSAIFNKKTVCNEIIEFSEYNGLNIINVNQGYTKCSVCVVSENAFITDDEDIYKSLTDAQIDALLVKKGSVGLKGFNYGFIGGCSGKLSKDTLAFCGNIKLHSDYEKIKAFANNYNVNLLSLSSGELTDIGSIIPITEIEV